MNLTEQFILHEGLRLKMYRDSVGKWTIGIGHNLTDKGITLAQAHGLFADDLAETRQALEEALDFFPTLDEVRQRVLLDMAFNMGIGGLLGFYATLGAIEAGDYKKAAAQMLKSKWATQVGDRATRLARWMETGVIDGK